MSMKFSILHIMALTAVIAMQIQSIPAMVIGIIGSMIVIFGGIFSLMVGSLLPLHTSGIWLQTGNAGECSSKYVVFYPLFAFSIVILIAGLAMYRGSSKRFIRD